MDFGGWDFTSVNVWAWLQWQWRAPELLWLAGVPFLWWLGLRFRRRYRNASFADQHLWPWIAVSESDNYLRRPDDPSKNTRPGRFYYALKRGVRGALMPGVWLTVAWISGVIVLAGPYSLKSETQTTDRKGVDVLIGLDLSRSMTAEDVSPNRFKFARFMVESLKDKLTPQDRLGLMVFAGKPHLVSPLTFDRALFQHYLDLVEPGLLPTAGSQLKPAIRFGVTHLQQTAGQARVLVIFTNGEPTNPVIQPDPKGWDRVIHSHTNIVLVGVGTPNRSRLPDADHATGYFHHFGRLILSRLETESLKTLAQQIQGEYMTADSSAKFLNQLTHAITIAAAKRTQLDEHAIKVDHAVPFLWVMWVALAWGLLAWPWREQAAKPVLSMIGIAGGLATLVLSMSPAPVLASSVQSLESEAYQAFREHAYDQSVQWYEQMQTQTNSTYNGAYKSAFGAGAAAYKKGDFESAVWYFQDAILAGRTDKARAKALFNLGNTYFQTGLLAQAIEAYENALVYWPEYEKARQNLELAKQQPPANKKTTQQMIGEGEGSGNRSKDQEGAFYGGQKPNPDMAGEGVSGDAPEGKKDGKEFVMPDEEDRTNFRLRPSQSLTQTDTGAAILEQKQRQKTIQEFEHKMQRVDDHQKELLRRLFERSEGFQAAQDETHPLPGVNPW